VLQIPCSVALAACGAGGGWSDENLADLSGIKGSDFEEVDIGTITTCPG
jgi:hypothetical protein